MSTSNVSNTDPDYLRKVSSSLRAKLSLPLKVYNPSLDNLHAATKGGDDVNRVDDRLPQSNGVASVNLWSPASLRPPKPPNSPAIVPSPAKEYNHEKRGTRSGPYEGHASGKWLEREMRADVDALAAAVDRACMDRGSLKSADKKSDLELQNIDLMALVTEQQKKIADLQLLVPTDDGHKALRRELADLEADADYYYGLYKKEEKEKLEFKKQKEEAMEKALDHIKALEIDFNNVKSQLESYASREAAMVIQESRRHELGLGVGQMAAPTPMQMHASSGDMHLPAAYNNAAPQNKRRSWCCSN